MKFSDMKIGARLGAGFGAMVLALTVIGFLGLMNTTQGLSSMETLNDNNRSAVALADAQDAVWALRWGVAQYIAVNEAAERAKIVAAQADIRKKFDAALKTYLDAPRAEAESAVVTKLMAAMETYSTTRLKWFALYDANKKDEAFQLRADVLTPAGADTVSELGALIHMQQQRSESSERSLTSSMTSARTLLIGLFVLAVVLAVFLNWLIARSITGPLGELLVGMETMRTGDFTRRLTVRGNDEISVLATGFNDMSSDLAAIVRQTQGSAVRVNSSITELSATSREQESMVSEVAATATQVAATSKEIASTAKELLRTMNEVSAMTETSGSLAASGQEGLVRMGDTMRGVMEASVTINTRLAMLNEKAGNISQVTTTIAKVADQTNLLSLNAAIEAEKAGEYGRGFAIVATEIRRLADQTAVASYDIELIVKEIQSAVSASVMGMDKFSEETRRGLSDIQQIGTQLSQVIEQMQILIPKFETVNEGMSSQTTGAEQISQALGQINEAMRQIVDAVRQSTMAVQEISSTANGLSGAVARFKVGA